MSLKAQNNLMLKKYLTWIKINILENKVDILENLAKVQLNKILRLI